MKNNQKNQTHFLFNLDYKVENKYSKVFPSSRKHIWEEFDENYKKISL